MARITPQEIVRVIVGAQGNLGLASERIKRTFNEEIRTDQLLAAVTAEGTSLSEQLRTAMILQLYATMMDTQAAFRANLDALPVAELGRAYSGQIAAFASLTARPTEDAIEKPVDISTAREHLLARLDQHEKRAASEPGPAAKADRDGSMYEQRGTG
jgi:hypothetical protein